MKLSVLVHLNIYRVQNEVHERRCLERTSHPSCWRAIHHILYWHYQGTSHPANSLSQLVATEFQFYLIEICSAESLSRRIRLRSTFFSYNATQHEMPCMEPRKLIYSPSSCLKPRHFLNKINTLSTIQHRCSLTCIYKLISQDDILTVRHIQVPSGAHVSLDWL